MKIGLSTSVLLYALIVIGATGLWLILKGAGSVHRQGAFTLAKRSLPPGVVVVTLALAIFGMASSAMKMNPAKKHHTPDGFVNNYPHDEHGFSQFLKWRWDAMGETPKTVEYPLAQNDLEYLQQNKTEATITWVGHATFLIQIAGVNILTDPQFSERASPVSFAGPKRCTPPGIKLKDLPVIDFVIISHNHYDHLDLPTLKALNARQSGNLPVLFVPLGLKAWLHDNGIENAQEFDWWEQGSFKEFKIHAVPVQHFSSRTPFDRNKTLWTGWVLEHAELKLFFAGDTGYSKDFLKIGGRFGPIDLSLIPVGAYEPRWFMKSMHVNPDEAVKVHQDLQSRYSIGMHWGTFLLTDEDMDEPPRHLKKALEQAKIPENAFFLMRHGETRQLDFLHQGSHQSYTLNEE